MPKGRYRMHEYLFGDMVTPRDLTREQSGCQFGDQGIHVRLG